MLSAQSGAVYSLFIPFCSAAGAGAWAEDKRNMRICLFERRFASKFSIQENSEKSIKKRVQNPTSWAKFTKSDDLTMETIPNCTIFYDVFYIKNL